MHFLYPKMSSKSLHDGATVIGAHFVSTQHHVDAMLSLPHAAVSFFVAAYPSANKRTIPADSKEAQDYNFVLDRLARQGGTNGDA
jgi:hypothetical protein